MLTARASCLYDCPPASDLLVLHLFACIMSLGREFGAVCCFEAQNKVLVFNNITMLSSCSLPFIAVEFDPDNNVVTSCVPGYKNRGFHTFVRSHESGKATKLWQILENLSYLWHTVKIICSPSKFNNN